MRWRSVHDSATLLSHSKPCGTVVPAVPPDAMTALAHRDFTLSPEDTERLANLSGPFDGHLRQIEVELGLVLHQREAFGIGLHHPVLDAVVDHLAEVAGATGPHVRPAAVFAARGTPAPTRRKYTSVADSPTAMSSPSTRKGCMADRAPPPSPSSTATSTPRFGPERGWSTTSRRCATLP